MLRPNLSQRRTVLVAAVTAAALSMNCGDRSSLTGPTNGSVLLDIVSGNTQTGIVGKELPLPLVVQVMDGKKAVSGALVNFRVIAGGGSMYAGSALTNKDGKAEDYLTLGTSLAPNANVVEIRTVDATTGAKQVWGTFKATGIPVPVASVSVSPASQSVTENKTVQLTATVSDADGNVLTDRAVTWGSSDETIAKVSATGLVTGVKAGGPVTITATSEGKAGTATITVTPPPVATVEVAPTSATLHVGDTQQLTATLRDDKGNVLTNRVVTWTSASTSIVTVSASGLVTGVANGGPVAVTATSEGVSASSSITVTTPQTLTVTKSGAGAGTVTSRQPGIDCGATCSAQFDQGTLVQLTATPAVGSTFVGWSGACTGAGQCEIALNAATTVTATFDVQQISVTVTKTGNGTGTVTSSPAGIDCGATCGARYPFGTTVTLTANAADGSIFTGWSSGPCTGTGPCTMTLFKDGVTVTATFIIIQQPLTVSLTGTGRGVVTSTPGKINCPLVCTDSYDNGTVVTLTATPDVGSTFLGWSGACTGTSQCTVTMTTARAVVANFDANLYPLTVFLAGTGSGRVTSPLGIDCGTTCQAQFSLGTLVPLTATPDANSTFTGWSGGGCNVPTPGCNVIVTGATPIQATFTLKPFNVAVNVVGGGTVTSAPSGINCPILCNAIFAGGTLVSLTETPAVGWVFVGWSGDPNCVGPATTCTFSSTGTAVITATFTPLNRTLVVLKDGNGVGNVISSPGGINCGSTCAAQFGSGATVTLTPTSFPLMVFAGWSGGGCSGTGTCTVVMTANTTVTATFNLVGEQPDVSRRAPRR